MQYLLWYLIIFLIILLVLYILEFYIPDKKNTLGNSKVYNFISKKFNLNIDKKRVRILSKIIVFANTFILSIPIMMVLFINLNYLEVLGISLLIFTVLILIVYNFIGYVLKKKGW